MNAKHTPVTKPAIRNMTRKALRGLWERTFGRRPGGNIKNETMIAKLEARALRVAEQAAEEAAKLEAEEKASTAKAVETAQAAAKARSKKAPRKRSKPATRQAAALKAPKPEPPDPFEGLNERIRVLLLRKVGRKGVIRDQGGKGTLWTILCERSERKRIRNGLVTAGVKTGKIRGDGDRGITFHL